MRRPRACSPPVDWPRQRREGGGVGAKARRQGRPGAGHEAEAESLAAHGVHVGGGDLVEAAEVGHALRILWQFKISRKDAKRQRGKEIQGCRACASRTPILVFFASLRLCVRSSLF